MSGGGWTGVGLLRAITGNLSVQMRIEFDTANGHLYGYNATVVHERTIRFH